MNGLYKIFMKKFLMILGCIATTAHADLPLTVEELTTDKNRFKLDTSVSYFLKSYSL